MVDGDILTRFEIRRENFPLQFFFAKMQQNFRLLSGIDIVPVEMERGESKSEPSIQGGYNRAALILPMNSI